MAIISAGTISFATTALAGPPEALASLSVGPSFAPSGLSQIAESNILLPIQLCSLRLGLIMLDDEFKKQRARTVRELAEKVIDPFIKKRLLDLAERYEPNYLPARTTTPVDLQFVSHSNDGSER